MHSMPDRRLQWRKSVRLNLVVLVSVSGVRTHAEAVHSMERGRIKRNGPSRLALQEETPEDMDVDQQTDTYTYNTDDDGWQEAGSRKKKRQQKKQQQQQQTVDLLQVCWRLGTCKARHKYGLRACHVSSLARRTKDVCTHARLVTCTAESPCLMHVWDMHRQASLRATLVTNMPNIKTPSFQPLTCMSMPAYAKLSCRIGSPLTLRPTTGWVGWLG